MRAANIKIQSTYTDCLGRYRKVVRLGEFYLSYIKITDGVISKQEHSVGITSFAKWAKATIVDLREGKFIGEEIKTPIPEYFETSLL